MLRRLAIDPEAADQVALDHREAGLPGNLAALLDFALKLSQRPADYGPGDIERLREVGFAEREIVEAVAMIALTEFLNTLQMGLGPPLDFEARLVFGEQPATASPNLAGLVPHPKSGTPDRGADPDREWVARARAGDAAAFDELVRRHSRLVYRTMVAITGNPADAEDDTQNALLRAFERLGEFRGESRFSTWITRIAINEGLQRRRRTWREEALDGEASEAPESRFAPRRVSSWIDDPERQYARKELRSLVERALLEVPSKYRLPVVLRDLEGLSGEEAAAALGIKLPTLKTQLLRGRLMLREALTPHFARRGRIGA